MRTYPFMQVDAFTATRLAGNACAILFDADDLDDATMLAIAREMNLAETAFVVRSRKADFGARYFTPKTEIPLAGHPTIATVFALAETGRLRLAGEVTTITLELTAGIIEVELFAPGGTVERVTMSQMKPQYLERYTAGEILPCLGLVESDLVPGLPLQVVSTGTPQLMIPVKDTGCLDRIQPDVVALEAFKAPKGISSVHISARPDRRPLHRIGHGRHGVLPLALRRHPRAGLRGRAGPVARAAGAGLRRGRRTARRHRDRSHRRPGDHRSRRHDYHLTATGRRAGGIDFSRLRLARPKLFRNA
jgi:PhzF family phenazine biosynthesis protein